MEGVRGSRVDERPACRPRRDACQGLGKAQTAQRDVGKAPGGRWRKAAIGAAASELLKRHTAPPAWRPGSRDPGETPGQAGALGPVGPCPLCVTCHRPHGGGHRAGQRRARTREQLRASQAPGGSPTASQGVRRGPRAHRTRRQNEWVTTPLGGAAGTFARTGVTKEHTWAPHGLDESDQLCGDLAPSSRGS